MNVLFLSVYSIADSSSGYIYADLIASFAKGGHSVYAVTPTSDKTQSFIDPAGVHIIKVKNGQVQKTGRIKKVINLLTLESETIKAVKKYAKEVKFDLVVNISSNQSYARTMSYFKKRDNAIAYLLLKDIFPQNALDIGMMSKSGLMGFVYRHFREKEKKLYMSADYIGCLSKANCRYLKEHNPEIPDEKITLCYNSIEPRDVLLSEDERRAFREKYGLPENAIVFVYGGNLGKPQGVPFIIRCLKTQENNENVFFLIVGDGTEYFRFENYVKEDDPKNVKVLKRLDRNDFDKMLAACDVGLIFLDSHFTVPNYPSRLLSYMQAALPVLACTDSSSDVGEDIENGGFGWRVSSDDEEGFADAVAQIENADRASMGRSALKYLHDNFTADETYRIITEAVTK